MDWLRRRQIDARPFLRPAQWRFLRSWNSNSVRFGEGERGKRHGFNVGDIHGTATGNLFFLLHGTGEITICGFSSFINSCLVRSFSLFERFFLWSNREGLCWRGKHHRWSKKSVDSPVDAEFEKWRSSLGGNWWPVNRGGFFRQQLPPHSFYGFHVTGGNCGVILMIFFWLSVKLFLIIFEKKNWFCKIYGREWYKI